MGEHRKFPYGIIDGHSAQWKPPQTGPYLEAVKIAREHRDAARAELAVAEAAFRQAIVRAAKHHSLRQIARAAGYRYHNSVKYHVDNERRRNDGHSDPGT